MADSYQDTSDTGNNTAARRSTSGLSDTLARILAAIALALSALALAISLGAASTAKEAVEGHSDPAAIEQMQ